MLEHCDTVGDCKRDLLGVALDFWEDLVKKRFLRRLRHHEVSLDELLEPLYIDFTSPNDDTVFVDRDGGVMIIRGETPVLFSPNGKYVRWL